MVRDGAAGRYRVALLGVTFRNLVSVNVSLQLNALPATVTELAVLGAAGYVNGNTEVVIQYRENLVAADIAANANNRISFLIVGDP